MAKRWIYNPRVIVPPVLGTNNWKEITMVSKYVPNTEVPMRAWAQKALWNPAAMFPAVMSGVITQVATSGANAQITTSQYKWLTSTLLTAQQRFNTRPYFQAKIIDETVQYNSSISVPTPVVNGASCMAPDGSTLCAGFIGSTPGINFGKSSDPSQGFSFLTIVAATNANLGNNSQITIACSDYINGSYRIDVYYATNLDNSLGGGNLQVGHVYSDNAGGTWNTGFTTQAITWAYNSSDVFCVAAGKPTRNADGTVQSLFFYNQANSATFQTTPNVYKGFDIYYQLYTGSGGVFGPGQKWSQRNANSADWTINSMCSEYVNGNHVVMFSGLHNVLESVNANLTQGNANYGIYVTTIRALTGTAANDFWDKPVNVMPTISPANVNQNQYTMPRLRYDGTYYWLTFHANVVDSVSSTAQGSTSSQVTANSYYYLMQSNDGINFTYPTAITDNTGVSFAGASAPNYRGFDFVKNGSYYYLIGGGNNGGSASMFQFILNSTVADVSNDIINYSIKENADQNDSLSLTIANQNGQWIGPAPTKTGYQAIQKNRRIAIFQGFYNASGVPEVAPRSDFFIDDIQQNVSATQNDFTIQARDLYKKLMTTTSRYTFNLNGPIFYSDVFDGSTISNWNAISGGWAELLNPTITNAADSPTTKNPVGGVMTAPIGTPLSTTDSVITLNGIADVRYGYTYAVTFQMPGAGNTTGIIHFYAWYQDKNNWLRLKLQQAGANTFNWAVEKNLAGSLSTLDSQNGVSGNYLTTNAYYTIYIVKYDYYKFNFVLGSNTGASVSGNDIATFNQFNAPGSGSTTLFFANGTNGEYDLTNNILAGSLTSPGTVGFGCNSYTPAFQFFKFAQFDQTNSIKDVLQAIGAKAGIFNYKIQNLIEDYFFDTTNYTGTGTFKNRFMTIGASASSIYNKIAGAVKNGEIQFTAKSTPTDVTAQSGLSLYFRVQNSSPFQDGYEFNINLRNSGAFTEAAFYFWKAGTRYLMCSSSPGVEYENTSFSAPPIYTHNLNIDITQYHTYKIVFYDGWMFAFVDNTLVLAWNDNNTTYPYWTSSTNDGGLWGFASNANSTMVVSNVISSVFWKPVQTHIINPGDDLLASVQGVIDAIRGWFFSDLMGRFKALVLNSTDAPTYTYQNQLYTQVVDNSDKEYMNQVTVYGLGVQATAQDKTSIGTNTKTRDAIIVDYSITTLADAQTRANFELTNFNKFNSQYSPTQVINVGAEIFDPVTIVNTGANSSNVSQNVRTYNQTLSVGQQQTSSGYDIEIQTGTL